MKKVTVLILGVLVLGMLLCLSNISKASEEPIVIGVPVATEFLFGKVGERGIELAVEEINREGGINVGGKKRLFKTEILNTRDLSSDISVEKNLDEIEEFVQEKKVDFILGGPVRSEVGLAAMDQFSRDKLINIFSVGVLTPAHQKKVKGDYEKYKYSFRITSHVGIVGKNFLEVAKLMREQFGWDKIYIMVQDVEHAKKGGTYMEKLFLENGFDVTGNRTYLTGTLDYVQGLIEAVNQQSEMLFLWMDMPESAILLKQWSELKLKIFPFGFVGAAQQPDFSDITEGKGNYLVVSLITGGNAPSNISPSTMEFVNAYEQKWGTEPEGYGASSSYIATYALKEAIEKADSLDPEAVVMALEDTDLMGPYGRIRFDKETHNVILSDNPEEGAVTGMIQWQDGKRVQIFPETVADNEILPPPWMEEDNE